MVLVKQYNCFVEGYLLKVFMLFFVPRGDRWYIEYVLVLLLQMMTGYCYSAIFMLNSWSV